MALIQILGHAGRRAQADPSPIAGGARERSLTDASDPPRGLSRRENRTSAERTGDRRWGTALRRGGRRAEMPVSRRACETKMERKDAGVHESARNGFRERQRRKWGQGRCAAQRTTGQFRAPETEGERWRSKGSACRKWSSLSMGGTESRKNGRLHHLQGKI
jgi:hypothetical protein